MNLARLCLFTMPEPSTAPLTFGDAYEGGFFAGKIIISEVTYNLVVAPYSGGEIGGFAYKTSGVVFTGNDSDFDGKLIQDNMVAAGIENFPLQENVMSLSIGGKTDWYIPSRLELEIVYRNLKPDATENSTDYGQNDCAVPPTSNYTTTDPTVTTSSSWVLGEGLQYMEPNYYLSATGLETDSNQLVLKNFSTGVEQPFASETVDHAYPTRVVRKVPA